MMAVCGNRCSLVCGRIEIPAKSFAKNPSDSMPASTSMEIEGRKVARSTLTKVFCPKTGFTKGEVIAYYLRNALVLLPQLEGRLISLKRYPDGVEGFFYYEKECPSHRPAWMKTTKVAKKEGGAVNYCMLNNLPSLVW